MQKLDHSTTAEYFELDMASQRFTHYPSGDTCLRHEWMHGRRYGEAWTKKLTEFFERHPDVSVIVNSRHEIIDSANSLPHRGGDYNVGDIVLVNVAEGEDDWGLCAKTIKERIDLAGDEFFDPHHRFKLDDDTLLFWRDGSNGWFTSAPQGEYIRARRPIEGEETLTLEQKKAACAAKSFGM
jgi:hypothetical protein